jgi:hypothetical protein
MKEATDRRGPFLVPSQKRPSQHLAQGMAGFGVFAIELVRWELLMPQKFHQGQSHKIASQNYGGTNWRPSTGAVALTLAPTSVAERGHGGLLLPSWEGKLTINPTLSGFSVNGRAKAGWMGVLHALRVEKVSFWIAADHRAMASPPSSRRKVSTSPAAPLCRDLS